MLHNKTIITLNDNDMIKMLETNKHGDEPESLFRQKIEDLRLGMESMPNQWPVLHSQFPGRIPSPGPDPGTLPYAHRIWSRLVALDRSSGWQRGTDFGGEVAESFVSGQFAQAFVDLFAGVVVIAAVVGQACL